MLPLPSPTLAPRPLEEHPHVSGPAALPLLLGPGPSPGWGRRRLAKEKAGSFSPMVPMALSLAGRSLLPWDRSPACVTIPLCALW